MNTEVNEDSFINMMKLWVIKNATYPLEIITFFKTDSGERFISIPDYLEPGTYMILGSKCYKNYQDALSKVGALIDKMDYEEILKQHKSTHPLSFPAFYCGFDSDDSAVNPYEDEHDKSEWEAGRYYRLNGNPPMFNRGYKF